MRTDCASRLQEEGIDLAGYTLAQRADDLEAARRAFGYERIDLLSQSAGTRTAMIYSWRYPASLHRSVMIGANPPGHFLWHPQATDAQIRRYAELCADDETCHGRTDDLAALMTRTAADPPDHWWFLPIKSDHVRTASFWGLMESTSKGAPLTGPMTIDSWISAAAGDASGFWFQSLGADMLFPNAFIWGDVAAAAQADTNAARRYFSTDSRRADPILTDAGTRFLWGDGRLVDAWPANAGEDQYTRVQTSKAETLLVGGELDLATPPQVATDELLPHLPNGHQVVLAELGHTQDFWSYQPEASSRMINTFFDSGTVDDTGYRPATVDFTPKVTQTAIAKGIGYSMVGVSLLAIVSLLGMSRHVRRRGGFGRVAGALLRSLYPMVLGLGGWFLGALVVLTTMPDLPLDDAVLAVAGVGVPIGLGIYWAWVRRTWSRPTKIIGFVAATAGALAGAWLGFKAVTGLLALITAIVGAAAGANLTVILVDIARERSIRVRRGATATSDTTPSRPQAATASQRVSV
jgi:pimeloyl-ACP methyl ester carboxylesterase